MTARRTGEPVCRSQVRSMTIGMEHDIADWRLVESEDVELVANVQKGYENGVLGLGRLYGLPTHGHHW